MYKCSHKKAHYILPILIRRSPSWFLLSGLILIMSWTNFLLREKTNWASGSSTLTTSPPGLFRNWSACRWGGGRSTHHRHLTWHIMTSSWRNTLWTFLRRPRIKRRWCSRRFSRSSSRSWTWPKTRQRRGSRLTRTLHWVPGCELSHLNSPFWELAQVFM